MGAGSSRRMGWGGGGVIVAVREQQDSMELWLGVHNKPAESMWVRISQVTYTGDTAEASATDCVIRKKDNWKKPQGCRPWSSWRT